MSENKKWVYAFSEGDASMVNLLGGKGANLSEMSKLGVPVPPGFVIVTEMCNVYFENGGKMPKEGIVQVESAMKHLEKEINRKFGEAENPLLLSIRSGARKSMPGMMETVLNVGLCSKTIPGMIKNTKDERFVYDSYRRLITMFSDVVMEKAAGIEPEGDDEGVRPQLEKCFASFKKEKGYSKDTDLNTQDLKFICAEYKKIIKRVLNKECPDDPWEQLWGSINAVFQSWQGRRAIAYRAVEGIPSDWGTAVNVQTMVFGNLGNDSATGVAFTRDPATGDPHFYGEWLVNAQGEDVVAGIRTPNALNDYCKQSGRNDVLPSLEEAMPSAYKQLVEIRNKLEKHYHDMQDLEFTIEHGRLWMLQTRNGKRNGIAAVRMAMDMLDEKLIDEKTALMRVNPEQLNELLHPMLDPNAEKTAVQLTKGLPAGPGAAKGKIVLNSERAHEMAEQGETVILVRMETSPEDVDGMRVAKGIVTAHGGMTSHAALVARGWGKCCIVGCSDLDINYKERTLTMGGRKLKEGDWISLNGTIGVVYESELPVVDADPDRNPWYRKLIQIADRTRRLGIRTNADRPHDTEVAVKFGAEGIGLCRTEHMFFEGERIISMRKMILADTPEQRKKALDELLPLQRDDFIKIFTALEGRPATIRLLDPPLHEFVPHDEFGQQEMAEAMDVSMEKIREKVNTLHEFNPMLGHRGCRLGITFPEITVMQARAIIEAAYAVEGAQAEIMIPLVGNILEFSNQKKIVLDVLDLIKAERHQEKAPKIKIGTMIEVPRGAVTADKIAEEAEFFSFGTNDLTQMGCGFSRDDAGKFLKHYVSLGIYERDPFQSLDIIGVGELVRIAVEKGKKTRPNIKLGVCGEHGGDPKSIHFFHKVGLDYVSCSPYRVPIARLAAAQAALEK